MKDAPEVRHRRARLRELIQKRFDGKQIELIEYIQDRTDRRPNQGELSALVIDNGKKAFGEKKGWNLATQLGLTRNWFDLPMGADIPGAPSAVHSAEEPRASYGHPVPEIAEMVRLMEALDAAQRQKCLQLVRTALDIQLPPGDFSERTGT